MRRLLTLDAKDYAPGLPVYRRVNVRALIERRGALAMERSRVGEYKLPGGSVDRGEREEEALCREVREELGLVVRRESLRPLGEILERRLDLYKKGRIYQCLSRFYACEVEDCTVAAALTASEREQGLTLCWARPEEVLRANAVFLDKPWIARDTAFVRLWLAERDSAAV